MLIERLQIPITARAQFALCFESDMTQQDLAKILRHQIEEVSTSVVCPKKMK